MRTFLVLYIVGALMSGFLAYFGPGYIKANQPAIHIIVRG